MGANFSQDDESVYDGLLKEFFYKILLTWAHFEWNSK